MANKQSRYILSQKKPPKIPNATNTPSISSSRINCDQLVTEYLQFSLAGDIDQQVESTKTWLKNNKSEGKKAVKLAERELKRSCTGSGAKSGVQELLKTDSKRITELIVPVCTKNVVPEIFNEQEMEKIAFNREEQEAMYRRKMEHMKNIDNYLHQISKLKAKKKNSQQQLIQKQNPNTTTLLNHTLATHNHTIAGMTNYKSLNSSISCLSLKSNIASRNLSPLGFGSNANMNSYHPFLERNLSMLYESKKKGICKKFQFTRHKAGNYY